MGHSQRTINSTTVSRFSSLVSTVVFFAKVVGSKAKENGLFAAQVTFPSNVLTSMFLTVELSTSNLLDLALIAN